MSIVVLRGINLEIELGLVFISNHHLDHLQMTKYYPHSKEGNCFYSNKLTNFETIVL